MILALAITLTAAPLGAQEGGGVEVGLFARYSLFDASLPMDNRLGGGARMGAFLFPNLLIEADVSYTSTVEGGDETARYVPFHAYVVYSHPLSTRASLRLGAGWAHNEYPHLRDGADNGVAGLVSLRVLLEPSVALRVDGTLDFMPVPANLAAVNTNTGLQVGLSFRFGRPGSSPPAGPVVIGVPSEPADEPVPVREGDADRSRETAAQADSGAVVPPGGTVNRADPDSMQPADTGAMTPVETGRAASADSAVRLPSEPRAVASPDTSPAAPADTAAVISADRRDLAPADTATDTGAADPGDTRGLEPADTSALGGAAATDSLAARRSERPEEAGQGEAAADRAPDPVPAAAREAPPVEAAGVADRREPRPGEARYAVPAGFALPSFGESVVLEGVVFGGPRTALLMPRSQAVLNGVAAAIQNGPPGAVYEVAGYTDDAGDANFNERLSLARANVVRWYLLGRGVAPERLVAEGYGPAQPRTSNETEEGRALNRRVELRRLR